MKKLFYLVLMIISKPLMKASGCVLVDQNEYAALKEAAAVLVEIDAGRKSGDSLRAGNAVASMAPVIAKLPPPKKS